MLDLIIQSYLSQDMAGSARNMDEAKKSSATLATNLQMRDAEMFSFFDLNEIESAIAEYLLGGAS